MTDKLIIRTSDRALFKQCRQKWNMNSKIRLDYEELKPRDYLEFGTSWHAAMQAWYEPGGNEVTGQFQSAEREKVAEAAFCQANEDQWRNLDALGYGGPDLDTDFAEREKLGLGMLAYYFGWSRIHDDFEPVTVEHEFEVPIEDDGYELVGVVNDAFGELDIHRVESGLRIAANAMPIVYQGRIDGLVRDFRGHYFILEHKTAKREAPTKWLQMDDQCGSYCWALQKMLGVPIKGVIYRRAYKVFPTKPRMLKDGSISCDRRQSTTASLFLEAIEEAHPFRPAYETITESEKYLNYHQFLTDSDVAPVFVEEHITTRNPKQIEDIGRRIALEAMDMLNDPHIYPNVTPINCNSCAFFGPCMTKQDGGDWEYHLRSEFRKRDNG